jgi:tetratricopeptide (TPR) repeat protein
MPTHIDVLVGDYESCVRYNHLAITADEKMMRVSPDTAGTESFYFGYIVHNFHMLVYGAILGGMEAIAMETAHKLNAHLNEDLFVQNPDLTAYLEAYSALGKLFLADFPCLNSVEISSSLPDIHVMVRFGRWKRILELPFPKYPLLMLYRSASLHFARGLALANTGHLDMAITEANLFDELRLNPSAEMRILHNNTVLDLFAVDAPMLRGEIAYKKGDYSEAFALLRTSVERQDGLNYDEPWGKMQPIRHALGGLLCEQGYFDEGEVVFRKDLHFHPNNPFGVIGLIGCLRGRLKLAQGSCCKKKMTCSSFPAKLSSEDIEKIEGEIIRLEESLDEQRQSSFADFPIRVPCQCCAHSLAKTVP